MIPATFTLLVAAAGTNALPIFSGFFAPRAVAPAPAATLQRRDLNSTQFAQGTNFFFSSLLLEAECTPGQVACIDGKSATCSAEANWEVTPCSGNTTCYAVPASSTNSTDDAVVVQCMTQDDAVAAFGTSNISEDFQITAAPFNSTVSDDPSSTNSTSTDSFTDIPSATDSSTDSPTPTGDDATPTDSSTPDATCTEDPEPTETETITVIAIPVGDNSTDFSYSTVFPTPTDTGDNTDTAATPTATDTETGSVSDAVPSPTSTECAGTTYQPTTLTTCDDVATLFGISSDDVSSNNSFVDCNNIWAYTVLCLPAGATPSDTGSSSDATPSPTDSPTTDGSSDPTPSDSASSTDDATPTTLSVPPAIASPSTPANAADAPVVSVVDTHVIAATSSIVPPANLKMRKVRRS